MAIITDVRFAHENGALADTLRSLPELSVSIVRETGTVPGQRVCFLRFEDIETDRLRPALDADQTVRRARPMSAIDGQRLWEIEFAAEAKLLGPTVTAQGGVVIDARRSSTGGSGWRERWLVSDLDGLSVIWQHAREAGFEIDVLDLSRQLRPAGTLVSADPLTDQQRTALVTAYEQGYFTEPRDVTLESLADSLDISPAAASGRLKRGLRALIEETLVDTAGESGRDAAIEPTHHP